MNDALLNFSITNVGPVYVGKNIAFFQLRRHIKTINLIFFYSNNYARQPNFLGDKWI